MIFRIILKNNSKIISKNQYSKQYKKTTFKINSKISSKMI